MAISLWSTVLLCIDMLSSKGTFFLHSECGLVNEWPKSSCLNFSSLFTAEPRSQVSLRSHGWWPLLSTLYSYCPHWKGFVLSLCGFWQPYSDMFQKRVSRSRVKIDTGLISQLGVLHFSLRDLKGGRGGGFYSLHSHNVWGLVLAFSNWSPRTLNALKWDEHYWEQNVL